MKKITGHFINEKSRCEKCSLGIKISKCNFKVLFGVIALCIFIASSQSGCVALKLLLKAPQNDQKDYLNLDIEELNDLDSCNKAGKELLASGSYFKAREVFHKALEFNPDDPEANNYLGRAYFYTSDNSKAKMFLQTAIAIKPDYADAYYNLGDVYLREGNLEVAMKNFKTAIKINSAYKNKIRHFYGEDFIPLR